MILKAGKLVVSPNKVFVHGDSLATSAEMNSCFTSVSDGKADIASAITGKGVSTSATASFDTMANNIGKIKSAPDLIYEDAMTTLTINPTVASNIDKNTLGSMYLIVGDDNSGGKYENRNISCVKPTTIMLSGERVAHTALLFVTNACTNKKIFFTNTTISGIFTGSRTMNVGISTTATVNSCFGLGNKYYCMYRILAITGGYAYAMAQKSYYISKSRGEAFPTNKTEIGEATGWLDSNGGNYFVAPTKDQLTTWSSAIGSTMFAFSQTGNAQSIRPNIWSCTDDGKYGSYYYIGFDANGTGTFQCMAPWYDRADNLPYVKFRV